MSSDITWATGATAVPETLPTDQPALLGGPQAVIEPFPSWPQHDHLEMENLRRVLESGAWWRMSGDAVSTFERAFARRHGRDWALATTNGTHALEAALRALEIGPGDEVIVPALTFVATSMPVFAVGACPIPVDVDPATWCLDIAAARAAMSPRTRAVIPVHFAGHPANMAGLDELCRDTGLTMIEDAAHAHGAAWNGRPVGSFGRLAAYSFQNFKLMSSGEGGILLAADEEIFQRAMLVGNCGRPHGETKYRHLVLGSNYRMSEFQAAILNAQLTRLDEQAERRERNAAELARLLSAEGLTIQRRAEEVTRHAWYMFVFTVPTGSVGGLDRDRFVQALAAEGVPALSMYPRVQDTDHFPRCLEGSGRRMKDLPATPVSRHLAATGVWIHHRALLGDDRQVRQIAEAVRKIHAAASSLSAKSAELRGTTA